MRRSTLLYALSLPALFACAGPADEDHGGIDVLEPGQTFHEVAIAGRWVAPPDVVAIGDQQDVSYDGSGPWNDGAGCADWMLPGTVMLRDELYAYFPQIDHIGGFNCRPIVGSSNTLSQHGTGRALDIMIPTIDGQADNTAGDEIAHWLIENAEAIGVQAIIWDRGIWKVNRTPRMYDYNGTHPHHDHLHVEINEDAAALGPTWYDAPFGPGPCGTVPAGETLLDETSDCFRVYGPSQFWRSEGGVGYDGALLWTNAFENDTPSNWARWTLNMETGGDYELEVYIDPTFGVWDAVRYTVTAAGAETDVVIDQSVADGWTSLGVFPFDPGAGQAVEVYDNYAGAVPDDQHIVVDALRVRPWSPEPAPEPEQPETEQPEPEQPGTTEPEDNHQDVSARPITPLQADRKKVSVQQQPFGETPSVESSGCSQAGGDISPLWLLGLLALVRRRRR